MRANVERVERERPRLVAGLEAAGWRPQPSVTNFLLLDLVTPERAEAASLALMRRGLVPRTFGPATRSPTACGSPSATPTRTTG